MMQSKQCLATRYDKRSWSMNCQFFLVTVVFHFISVCMFVRGGGSEVRGEGSYIGLDLLLPKDRVMSKVLDDFCVLAH